VLSDMFGFLESSWKFPYKTAPVEMIATAEVLNQKCPEDLNTELAIELRDFAKLDSRPIVLEATE